MTLRSFVDCCKTFAAFIFSVRSFPNNHSSNDTSFSISLKGALMFFRIKLLRIDVSSCCKSANSLATPMSGSKYSFFLAGFDFNTSSIVFPTPASEAAIFSCFSTIHSSLFWIVLFTAALTSKFNFGGSIEMQFFGGGNFFNNVFRSSAGNPFSIISHQIVAK